MNKNDFFAQSESDALKDFEDSCAQTRNSAWDWIVLTAANELQAKTYRIQIEKRRKENRLPINTKFLVVPDFEDKRIGSGGATFNVLRALAEIQPLRKVLEQRILVCHSGGDSKRIPQYSACGKLFAPVPRMLSGGYVSTILDELLISVVNIPSRSGHGMLILPSDTKLLFNAVQVDLLSCDAAGLSMKAPVAEGQEHGVFVQSAQCIGDQPRNVSLFLHKQPESLLREFGAVDSSNQVDIDTGCIWIGKRIIETLIDLISTNDQIAEDKFRKFANSKVCLNFYADFVYPMAENSTLDEYDREAPENGFSEELRECRHILWEKLHPFRMALLKLVPAQYIHFGMTHEMYDLFVNDIDSYSYLHWLRRLNTNANSGSCINCLCDQITSNAGRFYIEDSRISRCTLGEGVILSNVDIENETIPSNVVLHGLRLGSGKYVCRIYGHSDNPKSSKDAPFLGGTLSKLVSLSGISNEEIWDNQPASLWYARIYPICDSMQESIRSALDLYAILAGTASSDQIRKWRKSPKTSLAESFVLADIRSILTRQDEIRSEVQFSRFIHDLKSGRSMNECIADLIGLVQDKSQCLKKILSTAQNEEFPHNMRLYLAASRICKQIPELKSEFSYEKLEDDAYECIKQCIIQETFSRFGIKSGDQIHFIQDVTTVELPVRVNFCGSPSDAAPYCLEHGGTMLDGALLLKGKYPIQVTVRRRPDHCIGFGSLDQNKNEVFDNLDSIRQCGNPYDPYALHKATLVGCGLVSLHDDGSTMDSLCQKIGGGFDLLTAVDVPKGSGLGTSSILAAAALKALQQSLGISLTDEMIYAQVFLVEQLMNTGGGWQDQVGGLTPGLKYFSAAPGKYQKIEIDNLHLPQNTLDQLNRRFALIFSGQRRLARNVLREEMNQCISNDPKVLDTIQQIQEFCALMRFHLLRGDITAFAKYITKQFELVKTLDKGASNTYIEYIFHSCEDLLDGWSICGAGGGGFLQVILKENVDKSMLSKRIQETFIDCGIEVWDCTLLTGN